MDYLHYLDFEIIFSRQGENLYRAHVFNSPAGEAKATFSAPFVPLKLENLILRLTRLRSSTRSADSPEVAAARELGDGLFTALFQEEILACYRSSLEKARTQPNTGLRLKLRLQDVPELADLPWEFLYDGRYRRFMIKSVETPLVRYIEMPESITPLRVNLPLRILGIISSPTDFPPLDTQHEKELLVEALSPLIEKRQVEIDWLPLASLNNLRQALRQKTYHILHFIGHGCLEKDVGQGVLIFENQQYIGQRVTGSQLGDLLHDHRSLRLAVLNACEGARNTPQDPFAGVATTLLLQGLPAAVAMQFAISDSAALAFSADLYSTLAQGWPVDAAVSEARKAIFCLPDEIEWGTPVLYLRATDSLLFDLRSNQPTQVIPRELNIATAHPSVETDSYLESAQHALKNVQDSKPVEQNSASNIASSTSYQSTPHQLDAIFTEGASSHTPSYKLLRVITGHYKQVNSIAFSPDGKLLASGAGGLFMNIDTLRLWNIPQGTPASLFPKSTDSILSVAFSPDGSLIASGGEDRVVRLWMTDGSNECIRTLRPHTHVVASIAFSLDGKLLVSAPGPRTGVFLWRVADGALLQEVEGHKLKVRCITFSPDGNLLASGCLLGDVWLWRIANDTLFQKQKIDTLVLSVRSLAFSPDSKLLAVGSAEKTLSLWRVDDGQVIRKLSEHEYRSVKFSPDGRLLASASSNSIHLLDVATGELIQTLEGHEKAVRSLAFSPDGGLIASGSEDQTIRIWQRT